MSRLLRLWLPVLAWMGVIFYFSSIPYLKSPYAWDFLYRKLAHMTEYAVLAILLARALHPGPPPMNGRRETSALALGIAVAYALSDEYHQSFVPGREAAVLDVLVDSAGALAGLFLYRGKSGSI